MSHAKSDELNTERNQAFQNFSNAVQIAFANPKNLDLSLCLSDLANEHESIMADYCREIEKENKQAALSL